MRHKTILNSLILLLTAVLILGCEDSTGPGDGSNDKPPGYQEDIPWPSLADSPWPMYRADPQNTGRSKYQGPILGEIDWMIDTLFPASTVTTALDSSLYLGIFNHYYRPNQNLAGLLQLNENGTIKRITSFASFDNDPSSTPLINTEGTIYISAPKERKFLAINEDGSIKWSLDDVEILQSGINIDKNGTIYAVGLDGVNFLLYAINDTGEILWVLKGDFGGVDLYSMSLSPDSKTLYIPGHPNYGKKLYAIDTKEQEVKWSFGEDRSQMIADSPLVDDEGNIYILIEEEQNENINMVSLNDSGKVRWKYNVGKSHIVDFGPFCMDKSGNLYFGEEKLISLDNTGKLMFNYELTNNITSPITVDRDGIIYFITGMGSNSKFNAVDSKGNNVWDLNIPNLLKTTAAYSISIGYNNKLFISTLKSFKVVCIK